MTWAWRRERLEKIAGKELTSEEVVFLKMQGFELNNYGIEVGTRSFQKTFLIRTKDCFGYKIFLLGKYKKLENMSVFMKFQACLTVLGQACLRADF